MFIALTRYVHKGIEALDYISLWDLDQNLPQMYDCQPNLYLSQSIQLTVHWAGKAEPHMFSIVFVCFGPEIGPGGERGQVSIYFHWATIPYQNKI